MVYIIDASIKQPRRLNKPSYTKPENCFWSENIDSVKVVICITKIECVYSVCKYGKLIEVELWKQ